jgi:hypothetical protein
MAGFVVALTVGVTGAGATASTLSGAYGVVTKAPATPTCVEGQSCSSPAANVTLRVLASGGSVVETVRTNTAGRYRVALPSGRYRIEIRGTFRPTTVSITVGSGWLHRDIRIATGVV